MAWRVAKSLLHLRDQVNVRAPGRAKDNDGTIGDAAHQSRQSDHNPWVRDQGIGVVTALDITNDPSHGIVSRDIAESLRQSKDPRIKYVISNGEIFSSETFPWKWRKYSGADGHYHHMHVSAKSTKPLYDSEKDWSLPWSDQKQPPAAPLTLVDAVSLGDMAHTGEQGERVKKIQQALAKAGSPVAIDGDFGPFTEAEVKKFQTAKGLEADGIVGPATAAELDKYLGSNPPPPIPAAPPEADWKQGKGSWYSQFQGRFKWRDTGDAPGSSALGVPDNAQGVSFYDWATLGKWFEVEYPNGHRSIEQQTDIGPSPWTGKKIDVSAAAAERAGYNPRNFPTGEIIKWRRVDPPASVASLSPRQAAVAYRDSRKETEVA